MTTSALFCGVSRWSTKGSRIGSLDIGNSFVWNNSGHIHESVDEGVERNQLSILHPADVNAFDESGSAGRSILPGHASNAEVLLNRRGHRKDGAWKPMLHSRGCCAELLGSVMDAFGID